MTAAEQPYRVTVKSPLLAAPHVAYFDTREEGTAFMDRCESEGVTIGPLTLKPKAIGNLCLEGREGITVRPEPAVAMPKPALRG